MKFRKLTLLLATAVLALSCVACRTIPTRPGDTVVPRNTVPRDNNNVVPNRDTTPNTDRIQNGDITPNGDTTPNTDRVQNGDITPNGNTTPNGDMTPNTNTTPRTVNPR